jgi:hypothetical protein
VGTYGPVSYSSSKIPAEGKFVTRGTISLAESLLEIYNEQCSHKPGVTFAWNDSGPGVVLVSDNLGTGDCSTSYSFEHYFKDTDRHGRNDDYTVLDKLEMSYVASTGTFGLGVRKV